MSAYLSSLIEDWVFIDIRDELRLLKNPFVGMRVYLKSLGYSVKVTEVSEKGVVTGYYVITSDKTDAILEELFALQVTFDMSPEEDQEVEDGTISVTFSNFSAAYLGDEVDIYSIKINGTSIASSGTFEITESTTFTIAVQAYEGFAYYERTVNVIPGTYIFFRSETDPTEISLSLDEKIEKNHGLFYDSEIFTNSESDGGYLYIVGPDIVKYVKTSETPQWFVEGAVLLYSDNRYFWRSLNLLNKGNWTLTIR